MSTIPIEEAQAQLPSLISKLKPGEEIQITLNNQQVARLIAEPANLKKLRQAGSAIGRLKIVAQAETGWRLCIFGENTLVPSRKTWK